MMSGFQPPTIIATADRMGFATPKSPSDALRLLNGYLRTDLFYKVQRHAARNHETSQQSPVYSLASALEAVLATGSADPQRNVTANPYHLIEDHVLDPTADAAHDRELIRHHLTCLKQIIADIEH